ncbi:hypothetical protein EVAR_97798_1 [Eumeta japonica]|uniref:Uncharacterized protein n=1 Tax=Eumeta variegata TaxID=151549 RepID=A0A4C1XBF7_EUMVA|nr:hypothetical protein EVAR_97798_1 [Eumeta japonica]
MDIPILEEISSQRQKAVITLDSNNLKSLDEINTQICLQPVKINHSNEGLYDATIPMNICTRRSGGDNPLKPARRRGELTLGTHIGQCSRFSC